MQFSITLVLAINRYWSSKGMKVRTDIKAGASLQDAYQQLVKQFQNAEEKLTKPRVSIQRWFGN